MIRNLLFDMGRVLVQFEPALILARFSLSREEQDLLTREVLHSVEWICLDRGAMEPEDAISAICARLPRNLHGCARQLVLGWWEPAPLPMPGMAELIAALKHQGYGVYLLSNAHRNLRTFFPLIPGSEFFDGIYISSEHHLLKPEHEFFEDALQTFGLEAERCCFIDDSAANIEAASRLGIAGCRFCGDLLRLQRELQNLGIRW